MAFQAHQKNHGQVTAQTPRAAAELFFATFPKARKCNLIEGTIDNDFFTVVYDPKKWPRAFKDVTKKTIIELPET
ncbi:hypothetical protein [Aeromonas media]|uniref:hypothetical protein n=1 Tax=Aeromonas media TaxID=651 RepID=UPI003D1FCE85